MTTQSIYAGDDERLEFELLDESGDPLDLIGIDLHWALAVGPRQSIKLEATTTDTDDGTEKNAEIDLVDDGDGRFDVVLEPEATRDLGGRTYYHELNIRDAAGKVSTVLVDELEIKPAIINTHSSDE